MSLDILIDESTQLEEQVDGGSDDWDDDLVHICCGRCDPKVALCGGPLEGEDMEDFGADELCIVCIELAKPKPKCPTCGFRIRA